MLPNEEKKKVLLQICRNVIKQSGGRVVVRGTGNSKHIHLYGKDGRACTVWYPDDGRVNDLEIKDLAEATDWIRND